MIKKAVNSFSKQSNKAVVSLDNRRDILECIESIGPGTDEEEQRWGLARFLPLSAHARALEPDVLVILGGRGAGKTAFFNVLFESDVVAA
jgi:hypothetical protein